MPRVRSFLRLLASGLTMMSGWTVFPAPQAANAPGDIAVVVHSAVPATDLSFSEIRKILLGDRQFWTSGLRVTLVIREPETREREVLLKTVYQMSEAQFRQYWISKVFRAQATSGPRIAHSNKEAADVTSAIPGAITFVDASQLPKGLKVLRVDGHLPGEAEYALR